MSHTKTWNDFSKDELLERVNSAIETDLAGRLAAQPVMLLEGQLERARRSLESAVDDESAHRVMRGLFPTYEEGCELTRAFDARKFGLSHQRDWSAAQTLALTESHLLGDSVYG